MGGWINAKGTHGLVFQRYCNFAGRNYKMGPLARTLNRATSLSDLNWLCWLVAFMYLDVLLAVERGLQSAKKGR